MAPSLDSLQPIQDHLMQLELWTEEAHRIVGGIMPEPGVTHCRLIHNHDGTFSITFPTDFVHIPVNPRVVDGPGARKEIVFNTILPGSKSDD